MKRYESKQVILEEVERKARGVASKHLTWGPPYDEKDVEELWQKVRSRTRARITPSESKAARTRRQWLASRGQIGSIEHFDHAQGVAILVRDVLGLEHPAPLRELEGMLRRLGGIEQDSLEARFAEAWGAEIFAYPMDDLTEMTGIEGLGIFPISHMVFPRMTTMDAFQLALVRR